MADPVYTLQIVLATYPQSDRKGYINKIVEQYFKNYKTDSQKWLCDELPDGLYDPAIFHIFGNYDVAFISIIDSFKFTQKLFIPNKSGPAGSHQALYPNNTFQIFTGVHLSSSQPKESGKTGLFANLDELKTAKYLTVSSIKLNNGFLIGNGYAYLDSVKEIIEKLFKEEFSDLNYIQIQVFSWAEISLIIYGDQADRIAQLITSIRSKKIIDIEENRNNILEASLNSLPLQPSGRKYNHSHLISDSHSFFGVNFEKFQSETFFSNDKDWIPTVSIEWQIKPGHLSPLKASLSSYLTPEDEEIKFSFLTGKTDYLSSTSLNNLKHSQSIFRKLLVANSSESESLYEIVRKIKTRIIFDKHNEYTEEDTDHIQGKLGSSTISHSPKIIQKLLYSDEEIIEINSKLKALKLSRHLREKLVKIFFNFNNGINDSILFTYFLDFAGYIERLEKIISEQHAIFLSLLNNPDVQEEFKPLSVMRAEELFLKFIQVFEEGHSIRVLNNYSYEEISDFDLDFNSSIQQLLTIYSTLIFELSNGVLGGYHYNPVVSFNLKNTVGNYISINFGIHELTSPEFVFFTCFKEIAGVIAETDNAILGKEYQSLLNEFNRLTVSDSDVSEETYLDFVSLRGLFDQGLVNFDYLVADILRFATAFNFNAELYNYWFWSYNLQNASMYTKIGIFDEDHFKKELFRILLLFKCFNIKYSFSCPIAEIETYWQKYFQDYDRIIDAFFMRSTDVIKPEQVYYPLNKVMDLILSFLNTKNAHLSYFAQANNAYFKTHQRNFPNSAFELKEGAVNKINSLFPRLNAKYITLYDQHLFMESYKLTMKTSAQIMSGELVDYDESITPYAFMCAYMYAYLDTVKDLNEGKFQFLRRNWETGLPLSVFIKEDQKTDPNISHYIDPFGGIFFASHKSLTQYFKISNGAIKTLWHFSQKSKRGFMKYLLDRSEK